MNSLSIKFKIFQTKIRISDFLFLLKKKKSKILATLGQRSNLATGGAADMRLLTGDTHGSFPLVCWVDCLPDATSFPALGWTFGRRVYLNGAPGPNSTVLGLCAPEVLFFGASVSPDTSEPCPSTLPDFKPMGLNPTGMKIHLKV